MVVATVHMRVIPSWLVSQHSDEFPGCVSILLVQKPNIASFFALPKNSSLLFLFIFLESAVFVTVKHEFVLPITPSFFVTAVESNLLLFSDLQVSSIRLSSPFAFLLPLEFEPLLLLWPPI